MCHRERQVNQRGPTTRGQTYQKDLTFQQSFDQRESAHDENNVEIYNGLEVGWVQEEQIPLLLEDEAVELHLEEQEAAWLPLPVTISFLRYNRCKKPQWLQSQPIRMIKVE